MARTTSRFGTATRGLLISLWVAAAAVASWQAPQASAQLAGPAPVAELFPRVLDFGDVPTGTASASQTITFRNTGTAPLSISGIASVGGNFILVHDCPLGADSLAAGRYCTISVRFAPASGRNAGRRRAGERRHPCRGARNPPSGHRRGGGCEGRPQRQDRRLSGHHHPHDERPAVGGVHQQHDRLRLPDYLYYYPQGSELSDFSGYPALIYGSPPRGTAARRPRDEGDERPSPARRRAARLQRVLLPVRLNDGILGPGESCIAYIYFTPHELGLRMGELDFSFYDSSDNYVTETVLLVGNGVPVDFSGISLSTDTLDFGGVVVGTSATRTLSVTSTGTVPLFVTGVTTPGAGIFAATTDCDVSCRWVSRAP